MSIFISLTYKHPDDKQALKLENDYRAAMKEYLKYNTYRDAKLLFINTAVEVMKEIQNNNNLNNSSLKGK